MCGVTQSNLSFMQIEYELYKIMNLLFKIYGFLAYYSRKKQNVRKRQFNLKGGECDVINIAKDTRVQNYRVLCTNIQYMFAKKYLTREKALD